MAFRVALLGIYHESNTFIGGSTTLQNFRNGHWLTGMDIRKEYAQSFHEIGGMLEVLDREGIEVVPVMVAEATPGPPLSAECFDMLLQQMMSSLEKVLPVDGCMVVPHGAGVTDNYRDMDGHWLSVLRDRLGENIPVMGTLDPHASVSEKMIRATNALVAYKTNPHVDQRETGKIAAKLMADCLKNNRRPVQQWMPLPMAISIEQQCTLLEPCSALFSLAANLLNRSGILSTSVLLGFPYADVEEMGSGFIVVSSREGSVAAEVLATMKAYVFEHLTSFVGKRASISEIREFIQSAKKPALLLDMGDNVGGGSSGASTFLLDELESSGLSGFICVCDPAAVEICFSHERGDQFLLTFGRRFESGGEPFSGMMTLLNLADGKFMEITPRHGGQVNFDMGNTAILQTEKATLVMLTTFRTPPYSTNQLSSFGISPEDLDLIVAKGVNAPIAAYQPFCKTIIQVDSPGVTAADMTGFEYRYRRRPLFPFEMVANPAMVNLTAEI